MDLEIGYRHELPEDVHDAFEPPDDPVIQPGHRYHNRDGIGYEYGGSPYRNKDLERRNCHVFRFLIHATASTVTMDNNGIW